MRSIIMSMATVLLTSGLLSTPPTGLLVDEPLPRSPASTGAGSTMPQPTKATTPLVEVPLAETPRSSEAVQERAIKDVFSPQLGTLQLLMPPAMFSAVSYGGKCLDFGAPPQITGAPVFIYTCNGTIAQHIVVQEINARHEVILRAGTKVIGVKLSAPPAVLSPAVDPIVRDHRGEPPLLSPTPTPSLVLPDNGAILQDQRSNAQLAVPPFVMMMPVAQPSMAGNLLLELQDDVSLQGGRMEVTAISGSASGQIFALDGDSIILAADRTRVVQVQNNRGANRTPLVLGPRNLADAEFWTFIATDKSNRKPTSGFVRVPQEKDFVRAISDVDPQLHPGVVSWGTVIEVDPAVSIDLSNAYLNIPEGVTIRSNRRGTNYGAELWTKKVVSAEEPMLEIKANGVRIMGMRLRGPTGSLDRDSPDSYGIRAHSQFTSILDHNDLSKWTFAAVDVTGDSIPDRQDPRTRPTNLRVVRNFIHHNAKGGLGYGVVTGKGGFLSIENNTFVYNRHAIAGDGTEFTGYRAWSNLVQYPVPLYGVSNNPQQDFDMHGTGGDSQCESCGGIAGTYIEIARNTFLGGNRENFFLRGTPTFLAEFHHNVCVGKLGDVIKNYGDRSKLIVAGSEQFEVPNPTTHLGVGDFDGDGRDDLFLATGAAWYFAPAGNAEWRFLNAQTDGIDSLLFGDFDADGRTDVFTQHGSHWDVSWGGASQWEKINESNPALSEFRVGDFIGDKRADIFYADGQRWWVSDGGVDPFVNTQDSSKRTADLGFGDFNGDGKTDVAGVESGKWKVSLNATGPWADWPLRPALTPTMAGLMIADLNGNGRADIVSITRTTLRWNLKVSWDGKSDWKPLSPIPDSLPASLPVIGRFDSTGGADIVSFWYRQNHLGIKSSGVGALVRHSRQDMR